MTEPQRICQNCDEWMVLRIDVSGDFRFVDSNPRETEKQIQWWECPDCGAEEKL